MKYVKRALRSRAPKKKRMMKRKPMASVAKLTRQVRQLQSQNDGEKKRTTTFFQNGIGQLDGNTDGYVVTDVTPIPSQGVQTNQRTGASVRLHSTHYQFMIGQNVATTAPIRYKMTWLMPTGAPYSQGTLASQFITNVYQPNPFIGGSGTGATIRDYNSQYNPDYFNTYKVLRTIKGVIIPDQFSGQLMSKSFNVGFKYNKGKGHEVRFNQNTNGHDNVFNGQIILMIQCDRGNHNGTVDNTLTTGVYDKDKATGLFLQYNRVDYYYDN